MMTKEEIETRIAELEQERDVLIANTPYVRYVPRKTSHSKIRRKYIRRIAMLRKYGVEHNMQLSHVTEQCKQTKLKHFGKLGPGNTDKANATKLEHFGKAGPSNTDKANATKLKHFGKLGPANIAKLRQTCEERYDVPYFCMHAKCRAASGQIQSKLNERWHALLFERFGINFEYDYRIGLKLYDLRYDNVVVEINPTVSHNSAKSFDALVKNASKCAATHPTYHFYKTQDALRAGFICVTAFEWMSVEAVIAAIQAHLNNEPVLSTDFALNPQKSDNLQTIQKHWHNWHTHEHLIDNNFDADTMLQQQFYPVFDCGHAKV